MYNVQCNNPKCMPKIQPGHKYESHDRKWTKTNKTDTLIPLSVMPYCKNVFDSQLFGSKIALATHVSINLNSNQQCQLIALAMSNKNR